MITVLIVEDDQAVAGLMGHWSHAAHMMCRMATTLEQALIEVAAGGINVVALDLNLPDASGVTAVRAFHAAFPELPIVAFTGSEELEKPAIEAGATSFIRKPANFAEFAPAVWQAAIEAAVKRTTGPVRACLDRVDEKMDKFLTESGKLRIKP